MSKTNKVLIIIGSIIIFLICIVPLAMGVLGNLIDQLNPSSSAGQRTPTGKQEGVSSEHSVPEEIAELTTPTPTEKPLQLEPNILADENIICFHHQFEALSCLESDGWHIYKSNLFEYPFYMPTFFTQCSDGRIYLQAGKFYISDNGILNEFKDFSRSVTNLVCGQGDEIWVGHHEGVSHFDGSSWTTYEAREHFGSGDYVQLVRGIALAPKGDLWVITADSIVTFNGTNWQVFENGQGFDEEPDPKGLAIDNEGNVWIINSYDQLIKYNGEKWTTYTSAKMMNNLAIDRDNKIWVGTDKGIDVFDPSLSSWTTQYGEETFLDDRVSALTFDRSGRLWATTGYGFYVYDGSGWTAYHMHTADIFDNEADEILVLGAVENLPSPTQKELGSVSGKLTNPEVTSYTNIQVEVCIHGVIIVFYGATPCSGQVFHALSTVNPDGTFLVNNIPAGKYELMVQLDSDTWLNSESFEVSPGNETSLGAVDTTED